MKYIRNNTDNNISMKKIVDNVEKCIYFPKSVVSSFDDDFEALFAEDSKYKKLFTDGTLTYTVQPEEHYKNDFSRYFKGYRIIDTVTGKIEISVAPELRDKFVLFMYAVDGGAFSGVGGIFSETGKEVFTVGKIENYIEFRLTSSFDDDFPLLYSDRIKVYVK